MSKKLNEEVEYKILEYFFRGYSIDKISKKFNLTSYMVKKVLKENEVDTKRKSSSRIILERLAEPSARSRDTIIEELGLASKLFDLYPDINFWLTIKPAFLVASLKMLMTEKAKNRLDKMYKEYHYIPPRPKLVELKEEKLGEDYTITKKKMNMLELFKK